MALIVARFNTDMMLLVWIWWSDVILRYLHTSAQGFTSVFVVCMVQQRYYALVLPAHGV